MITATWIYERGLSTALLIGCSILLVKLAIIIWKEGL